MTQLCLMVLLSSWRMKSCGWSGFSFPEGPWTSSVSLVHTDEGQCYSHREYTSFNRSRISLVLWPVYKPFLLKLTPRETSDNLTAHFTSGTVLCVIHESSHLANWPVYYSQRKQLWRLRLLAQDYVAKLGASGTLLKCWLLGKQIRRIQV
jgi:hypothetical protein